MNVKIYNKDGFFKEIEVPSLSYIKVNGILVYNADV